MPENEKMKSVLAGMQVRSDTFDKDAGTVEVVYATGTPVGRGPFREVLTISEDAIDSERLDAGTVYLLNHHKTQGDHFGRVIDHRIEGGEAIATIKLSRDESKKGVIDDIEASVTRSVSVGYFILEYTDSEDDNGVETRTVTRWMPWEISLTPIPADVNAAFRSDEELASDPAEVSEETPEAAQEEPAPQGDEQGDDTVTAEENAEAATAEDTPETEEEDDMSDKIQEAVEAERSRVKAIADLAKRHGLGDDFVATHTDAGSDEDAVRSAALDAIAERSAPEVTTTNGTRADVIVDESEKLMQRAEDALMSRATGEEPSEAGREMRGMSLTEMARAFSGASGSVSASRAVELALSKRGMHGTSDFAHVIGNAVSKTLRNSYADAKRTFTPFVKVTEVANFQKVSRVQTGDAPELELVAEGGEFSYGTMGESAEEYKIDTFGRIVSVSRQMIVNDDLGAFTDLAKKYGRAAAKKENTLIYSILNGNAKMSDGIAMFHAKHGNLLTVDGINVASLAKVIAAASMQKTIDGNEMDVELATLIVNPNDKLAAQQVLGNISATSAGEFNPLVDSMQLVSDPRVAANTFFAAASPADVDTIELAYLAGERGVQTFTRDGFEVDGVEVKARLDVGAKAIDHRGLIRADISVSGSL